MNEDNYVCNVESNDVDAEEIVRRVNSYDNLVEALKEIKKWTEEELKAFGDSDMLRQVVHLAKQALKESEG